MEDGDKKVWLFPDTLFFATLMAPLALTHILFLIAWQKPNYVGSFLGYFVPLLILPLLPKVKWSELRLLKDTEVFMPHSKHLAINFPVYDYIGSIEGYFLVPYVWNGKIIINERIHEKLSPKALAWLIDFKISNYNMAFFKYLWSGTTVVCILILLVGLFGILRHIIPWSVFLIVIVMSWYIFVILLGNKLSRKNLKDLYDLSEKETALEALDYIDRTMNELQPPAPGKSKQLHTAKMRKIIADAEPKELT